ncbi:stage II sporulation protein R [Anaeromicropila populeti]|uniref:Stage II sporulation protein R n=1 Tax=Anaeromicropila populeti TaxID=37658 RepID=A0A1I6I749_9FIRM|nr:stage II sporulation protein R [Anaeromicropila populeti]SFR62210.1 stage II sporulation protein R [Anaeromicropila populeti]
MLNSKDSIKKKSKGSIKIVLLILFGAILIVNNMHKGQGARELQAGISEEIVRFHVRANSDSEEDQQLKLKVKDAVVSYLQKKLKNAKNINEAKKIMVVEMPQLEKISKRIIKKNGYSYNCQVILGQDNFPVKMYGDMTFPAGKYEALQVLIGSACGKNWWCVMFPTLCFVDSTYMVVPDDSKKLLKNVLSEEEYKSLVLSGDAEIEYKFKIEEWWHKIWGKK